MYDMLLYAEPKSGLNYSVHIARNDTYMLMLFIIPSILFVMISYCSFWINKEVTPSRISLCTVTILITISLINNVQTLVPKLDYNPWMTNFILGILMFTILTMVEFSILNFSSLYYNR